ncbi:MAG: hypothetical protein Q4P28_05725 [Tissierellia bacterium]|nr:hypothetical protein [Tissierellia bacterium]
MAIKKLLGILMVIALLSSCQDHEVEVKDEGENVHDSIEEQEDVEESEKEVGEKEEEDRGISWDHVLEYTNIPSEKTEEMHFRDRIRLRGEFPIDFIYGISQEEMDEIVDIAEDRIREAGYWDVEEAICQEIAERYPGNSVLYPNELTKGRLTGAKDPYRETIYSRERINLVEIYGLDPEDADQLTDEEISKALRMAYRDYFSMTDPEGFMILVLYNIFRMDSEIADRMSPDYYFTQGYGDYLEIEKRPLEYDLMEEELMERNILEHLGASDPRILKEITDRELRELMYNIERKYLDNDNDIYGDIGRFYSELALLYGTVWEIYPPENHYYYGLVEDHLLQIEKE